MLHEAQLAACEHARPGVTAESVDRAAREVIAKAGFGDYFVHRTGHGIGVETHEEPYIVEGNDDGARAGHGVLDRARHLPAGTARRPDRGHRGRHATDGIERLNVTDRQVVVLPAC